MARPKPATPGRTAILALVDQNRCLTIRVSPGASADAILLPRPAGPLAIRTTACPEDGRANAAVLRMLAKALGQPVSSLELVRGATSRDKLVRLLR